MLLISIIFHFFLDSESSLLAEQQHLLLPSDLISSFADCTGVRIWGFGKCGVFDMVPDHLQWLLHEQGNKRNPALTIL